MGLLLKQMNNLNYVKVDKQSAILHWDMLCEQVDTYFYNINWHQMSIMKATAGILGHSHNRKFRIHVIKEKVVNRRLQGKRV